MSRDTSWYSDGWSRRREEDDYKMKEMSYGQQLATKLSADEKKRKQALV